MNFIKSMKCLEEKMKNEDESWKGKNRKKQLESFLTHGCIEMFITLY